MISALDKRQLETLQQVAALLDFLKDPASFKKLVAEASSTTARLELAVNAKASVDKADGFLTQALATNAAAKEEREAAKKFSDEIKGKVLADKVKEEAAQAKSREDLAAAWSALRKDQQALLESGKTTQTLSQDLQKRLAEVEVREQTVTAREKALAEKASKIRQLAA